MATIYQKNLGSLTPQAGRTVSSFPSGMVRVDQIYTCASLDSEEFRQELSVGKFVPSGINLPSIVPLKIFPEAQEVTRVDGFTDFIVSAYGFTEPSEYSVRVNRRSVLIKLTANIPFRYFINDFKAKACVQTSESLEFSDLGLEDVSLEPFDYGASGNESYYWYTFYDPISAIYVQGVPTDFKMTESERVISNVGVVHRKYDVSAMVSGTRFDLGVQWISDPFITIPAVYENFGPVSEVDVTFDRIISFGPPTL